MKKLNEITEKNPFKVPENYFEDVNKKILSATSGYDHEFIKQTSIYKWLRPYLAVAAGIIGFAILSFAAVRLITNEKQKSQLTETMIEQNSEIYANDIDLYTIEENAANIGISDDRPNVSNKDIIDCLLLEDVEISDIYEQF